MTRGRRAETIQVVYRVVYEDEAGKALQTNPIMRIERARERAIEAVRAGRANVRITVTRQEGS